METHDNEKHGLRRVWAAVKNAVCSTWLVPVLCVVAAVVLATTADILCPVPHFSRTMIKVLNVEFSVVYYSFPLLLIWLVATCFLKQGWDKRGWRILFSMLAGVSLFVGWVMAGAFMQLHRGDEAADDWVVPEGVALEVPDNLNVEDNAPSIVKRLAGGTNRRVNDTRLIVGIPEEDFPVQAKNLEKLAQQHPDLLREFISRAQLLDRQEYLRAEEYDSGREPTKPDYKCEIKLHSDTLCDMDADEHPAPAVNAVEQLGNGWSLACSVYERPAAGDSPAENERLRGYAIQRLDAHFAKLAESPAMETVDALLPAPQAPCLHLVEGSQPGIYKLTLWLPKDARMDGHYEIRAYEYNTGRELNLDYPPGPILQPASTCELANALVLKKPKFVVHTGEWGQFYGSRWQVWFVPDKGKSQLVRKLVCEQLFLMQGYGNMYGE